MGSRTDHYQHGKPASTISYLTRPVPTDTETDHFEKFLPDQEVFRAPYCNDEMELFCQGLLWVMEGLK